MFPNMGDLFANLPQAMEEAGGIARSLDRIASSLDRIASILEADASLRASIYDQEVLGISTKKEGDTEDPGDHYVRTNASSVDSSS